MKKLFTAKHSIEAHLILAALSEAGIDAVVQGERLEPLMGKVGVVYPEVWIRNEADFERAKNVLVECQNSLLESPESAAPENDSDATKASESPETPVKLTDAGRKAALRIAVFFIAVVVLLALVIRPAKRHTDMFAARSGDVSEIEFLLSKKLIDVDLPDRNGMTMLHYAAGNKRLKIITLLLANGANVNAETLQGKTPLDFAQARGHEEVAKLLREAGGQLSEDRKGVRQFRLEIK